MQVIVNGGWILLCVAFAVILVTAFIMNRQSRHFYTMDVVLRRFSIMDLQLPDSPLELKNLITGIYALPANRKQHALRSLRGQLYVDFIFMPAAYGAIFLLCMKVSLKMANPGQYIFVVLAWLQVVAFLIDIIENFYTLSKIKADVKVPSLSEYRLMHRLVLTKWALALIGLICGLSSVLYFWLVGRFEVNSLKYAVILGGEILLFMLAGKFIKEVKQVT